MSDHLIEFKNLFKDDRQYIVPEYQRGYSWETRHREDLLDDIERVYKSGSDYKHFTGTIVAAKNGESDTYEVVDGQQRLTSLFLLSKMISNQIGNENLRRITGEKDERLILNTGNRRYFNKLIYGGNIDDPATKSQRNLKEAKSEFEDWINRNRDNLNVFANIILNKIGFLLFNPDRASKEMGIMFEVINNRGKPLSQLEKVKNYLTYYAQMAEEQSKTIANRVKSCWPDILKNLSEAGVNSNDGENSFLRYCWICFHSKNKQESYHVYKNLKKRFEIDKHDEKQGANLKEFILFLERCSNYYVDFFTKDDVSEPVIQLRLHPQYASVMPLYLAICEAYNKFNLIKPPKEELLDLLEKVNFRIYVCPDVTKRSDTHQGKFFGDARSLYDKISKGNQVQVGKELDNLVQRLRNRVQKECDAKTFVQSLTLDNDEDYNYVNWNGLKYFLANYENYLKKNEKVRLEKFFPPEEKKGDGADDTFSKEHLWATNNRKEDNNDRKKDYHQKKRLGNFVLLRKGINSRGGDSSIKEKIDIYSDDHRQSTLQMVINVKSFYKQAVEFVEEDRGRKNHTNEYYYELYKKLADLNEEKMVNFALVRWGLKLEKNTIVKIDSFEKRDDEAVYKIYEN